MNSFSELNHLVVVGHSRRWGKNLSTEFRKGVSKLLAEAERHLQDRFQRVAIRPVFFPPEDASSAHDTLNLVAESSFAILDVTDTDEELAFLAGALAARGVRTFLFADTNSAPRTDRWPFDTELLRYQTAEDLETKAETVFAGLAHVLETTPVSPRFIHTLWFPRDVSSIWIVCPQIQDPGEFAQPSSPDYTYLDNLGDTDSLLEVMVFLSRYYPSATIEKFSSRDFPIGLTKGNLVVIGGPGTPDTIYNELAKSIMEAQRSRVSYSEDCESMIVQGDGTEATVLQPKLTTKAAATNDRLNLVTDFGYFARFRNPANESNHVVCINGIHTLGVLGAARAFGNSREALRNYHTVLAKMRGTLEFECYFEVNALNRDVRVPRIEPRETFQFGVGVLPRHEKETIAEKTPVEKKPAPGKSEADSRDDSAQRMLQEKHGRLKVVNVLARQIAKTHGKLFEGTSGVLLLHALEDLPPFLEAFESLGLSPSEALFYYKRYPYLNKDKTLSWLRDRGYQTEPMEQLDKTLPEFLRRIDCSRRIFLLEDGGYVGPFLHRYNATPWDQIVGAVEQTERGVRLYEQIPNLRLPVAPVARCGLKNRQEPPHIGRTIVCNIQRLLSGRNLAGMRCLVIGYGRIGEAVCNAARGLGMNVSVYDSDHGALAKAAQESFNTRDDLRALLPDAQIVIGMTGSESIGQDHILSLQHNAVLVSGSSGQYEIGLEALDILSRDRTSVDIGTQYTLEREGRVILLLGDGYPINFVGGDSVPDEAIDPVLGALLVATIAMVQEPPSKNGVQLEWTNQVVARFELEKLYYDLYFSR